MMQTEQIRKLADLIEKCDDVEMYSHKKDMGPSFSMRFATYECGSAACIMGHNNVLHGREPSHANVASTIASDLGITEDKAIRLTVPCNRLAHYMRSRGEGAHITTAHAAMVLRHLATTGEVDWSAKPAAEESTG